MADTTTTGTRAMVTRATAMVDSKATADMEATATTTTPLDTMAMGVATTTVSDNHPKKRKCEKLCWSLSYGRHSVFFFLVLQTRAMQAMGKLQDVEATRVATSHTDHM